MIGAHVRGVHYPGLQAELPLTPFLDPASLHHQPLNFVKVSEASRLLVSRLSAASSDHSVFDPWEDHELTGPHRNLNIPTVSGLG